jgi:hypothetical protein
MLIRELCRHFPARLPEWANAFTMFAWGAYILMHPGIFASNQLYDAFVSMAWTDHSGQFVSAMAERQWGLITVFVGMLRACALFINGSYWRTPTIRLVCSAVSAFIWAQVVIGLLGLQMPSTGIVMYGSVLVLDLVSGYRAACDAVIATSLRRNERGAEKGGKSVSYPLGVAFR